MRGAIGDATDQEFDAIFLAALDEAHRLAVILNSYLSKIQRQHEVISIFLWAGLTIFSMVTALAFYRYQDQQQENLLALESGESRYHAIVDTLGNFDEAIFIIDADHNIQYMNQSMKEWYGNQTGEICFSSTYSKKEPGSAEPCAHCRLPEVIEEGKTVRYRTSSGEDTFDIIASPITNPDGSVSKIEIIRNITQQLRSEALSTRLGRIIEQTVNEIYLFDAKTLKFVQVNRGALNNLGYSPDEIKEMTAFDLKPKYNRETFEELVLPLRQGKHDKIVFETLHERKDGSLYTVELHLQLMAQESPPLFSSIGLDVTERKRTLDTLRKTNRALAVLSKCTHAIVHITDENDLLNEICRLIVETSSYKLAWVGFAEHDEKKSVRVAAQSGEKEGYLEANPVTWAEDDPRGGGSTGRAIRSGKPCVAKDIRTEPALGPWREAALAQGYASNIGLPLLDSGAAFGVLLIYAPEPDAFDKEEVSLLATLASNLSYGIMTLRSNQERQMIKEQLLHAQRMDAIGKLTGGIAHEFNNLLTIINGFSHMAQRKPGEIKHVKLCLDEIIKAGQQASELTSQMLAFSRKQILKTVVVGASDLLDNLKSLLSPLIGENIDLTLDVEHEDLFLKADPTQLSQALLNLAINARDAMPDGGALVISASQVELDNMFLARRNTRILPGSYVAFSVTDNGTGFDKELKARIFEPFFTTKDPGSGTGLGLSMVYGIVDQSGGFLDCESSPGKGSTFTIYLPVASKDDLESDEGASEDVPHGEGESILVVEDERGVREMARLALEEQGYRVFTAINGEEACRFFQNDGEADLVLTDVAMPGMDGPTLVEKLLVDSPELKVIFMSGNSGRSERNDHRVFENASYLRKPFKPDHLVRLVGKVLNC